MISFVKSKITKIENDHNYYIYYSKFKNYLSKMQELEQIPKKEFQKMLIKENFQQVTSKQLIYKRNTF